MRNEITSLARARLVLEDVLALHGIEEEQPELARAIAARAQLVPAIHAFGRNVLEADITKEGRTWIAKRGTDGMRWFLLGDSSADVRSAVAACGTYGQRVALLHDVDSTVRGIARDRIDDELP